MVELATMPQRLFDKLRAGNDSHPAEESINRPTLQPGNYGAAALDKELAALKCASNGTRNDQLNRAALSLGQLIAGGELDRGPVETALYAAAVGIGLPPNEVKATIKSGIEAGMKQPRCAKDAGKTKVGTIVPTSDAAEPMWAVGLDTKAAIGMVYEGQKGCAELFARLNAGRFCFDHTAGTWHVFQDHYWDHADVCQPIKAVDAVQDIFKRIEVELSADIIAMSEKVRTCDSTEESQKLLGKIKTAEGNAKAASAIVKNLNTLAFRKQVVEFSAVGEGSLGVSGTEWDLHPWLLACVNGVIDLKTGTLTPGRPEQYIKAHCPTPYDPAATAPIYKKALSEIFDGNQELIDFFQRIIGMALVGAVYEHKLIVLEGRGRNGKDTLLSAICHTLGAKLAGAIQSEILLDQGRMRSSAGPSADIMRLQGLRLAFASETNEGAWMNAGKLKLLTGGGELVGRAPYARREVAFSPSHTLMLLTNSKPHAPADDFALWKRLILIPFGLSFVENPEKSNERKADRHLVDNLRAEASGILNWMVEGCLEWQRIGLNPPAIVREATRAYQRDEDVIQQFIDDVCVCGNCTVGASALYDHYRQWMTTNGMKPASGTMFGRKMAERFTKEKSRSGIVYIGIGMPAM